MEKRTEPAIEPTDIVNGDIYYNMGKAAMYCRLSITGFRAKLAKWNKDHEGQQEEQIVVLEDGSRSKLVKKSDLDKLMRRKPVIYK